MRFKRIAAALIMFAGAGVGLAGTAQAAPDKVVLGGSSGILFDNNSVCSLAAIGYDRDGRLIGLTAGHCAPEGARVASEANPRAGVLGVMALSDEGKSLDVGVIVFNPDRVAPVRTIGATTINGFGTPPGLGATVCANGRTTGPNCGLVWGNLDRVTTLTQSCSNPGDSGGPVTIGDRLVGINQGKLVGYKGVGFDIPCTNAANPIHSPAYFAPIDVVLRAINNHNGVGAGFHTV